jgi:hypothetical protein
MLLSGASYREHSSPSLRSSASAQVPGRAAIPSSAATNQ